MTADALPRWDLADLYAAIDDPRIQTTIDACESQAIEFETTFRGSIASNDLTARHLLEALDAYEALMVAIYKPQCYAHLLYATDTRDTARGALLQKTREFGSSVGIHLVFFDLEIGDIPTTIYDRISNDPILACYRHYLDVQRAQAVHNLTASEEKILVETANTRGTAFTRLFTEIQGRTKYALKQDGETRLLEQSEVLALLHNDDRNVRRAAAASVSTAMADKAHICSFVYNTLLHEHQVMDRLRNFDQPESSRHLHNELDSRIIDTVTEVCVANYSIVGDYYRLKGRLLGIEDLTHYDRYAPIVGAAADIPFDRAQKLVLAAFRDFSPQLEEIAEPFFGRCWIDAAVSEGKQGGAFCAGVTPDLHPFILMNYTGQARDVMTLAHELGHGIHDVFASGNHLLDYHPVLPMAETASTFAEMLVFDRLRDELSSGQARLALVCGKIEDTFATVFRQIAMYRFEQQAHRARRDEGELPPEKFDALWQENMQEMFGDALTLGEEHSTWWRYIPHVVNTPFYVYAYAFGELLVLCLYARYLSEGSDFVAKYTGLLAAGGSRSPTTLVSDMGFDITDRAFWQGGCDLIRARVSEAEKLATRAHCGKML